MTAIEAHKLAENAHPGGGPGAAALLDRRHRGLPQEPLDQRFSRRLIEDEDVVPDEREAKLAQTRDFREGFTLRGQEGPLNSPLSLTILIWLAAPSKGECERPHIFCDRCARPAGFPLVAVAVKGDLRATAF